MQNNPFYKFYQKSLEERKETLLNHPNLSNEAKALLEKVLNFQSPLLTKWSKIKLKYTAFRMESFQN